MHLALSPLTLYFAGASLNHKSLQEHGITHVINWSSSTASCNVFEDVEYLCIQNIRGDAGMQRHISDIARAVDFVEAARKACGKAISHCWHVKIGQSLS